MASPAATLRPANSAFAPLEIILFSCSTSLSANVADRSSGAPQISANSISHELEETPLTTKSNGYGDPPTSRRESWGMRVVMVQRTPRWQEGRRKGKEFTPLSHMATSPTDLRHFLLRAMLCSSCIFKSPLCQALTFYPFHHEDFTAS